MKNRDVLLFTILLILCATRSFGSELYEFYNGARMMGMGGASVAVVNDETALISNPAALGKLRSSYFTIADPEIHLSEGATQAVKDEGYDITIAMDPQELLDLMNANPDKHYHMKANFFPSFVSTHFGIGLLANYSYDAEVDSATSMFNLRHRNDFALLLGYNFRFFDGKIKFGFNGKYINRAEVDTSLPSASTGLDWDTLVEEGTGIGADVGLIMTAPWTYLPTLAAVLRDVGDTSYTFSSGMFYDNVTEPAKTKQSLDVGFSVTPILGKYMRLQITGELQDVLTYSDEEDSSKRIHAGMELNIYDKMFIRGGWNQRYWTAGFELSGQFMQFQLASYGEEIGTNDVKKEDRRYVVKFAVRF